MAILRNQNSGGSIHQGSSVKKLGYGGGMRSQQCPPGHHTDPRTGRCVSLRTRPTMNRGGRTRSTMNRGGTTLASSIVQTGKGRGRKPGMGRKSVVPRNRNPRPAMRRR